MTLNLGWLNRNCQRRYPLTENAPGEAINSPWVLSDRILADAFILTQDIGDRVYLSAVTLTRTIISVTFASASTGRSLASASAVLGIDEPFTQKPLLPLEAGVSGFVTFGSALEPSFFTSPDFLQGMHRFSADTKLEVRAGLATGPFPVRSLRSPGSPVVSGVIELATNNQLVISKSVLVEGGDPVTVLTLNLVEPAAFLSPCEIPTSPCQCRQSPIRTINGVTGDENGKITIEIVDANGNVTLLGVNALNFSVLTPGEVQCERPVMPDAYGRLPNAEGGYDQDAKPITEYKNPLDTTFPEPIL